MLVQCDKCRRMYDDATRWTICPHSPLGRPIDDLCPQCDTLRSVQGPCHHQRAIDEAKVINECIERGGRSPKLSTLSVEGLQVYLNCLALAIIDMLPAGDSKQGSAFFALVIAENEGEGSMGRIVTNAHRDDAIELLRDAANNLERSEGHAAHKQEKPK